MTNDIIFSKSFYFTAYRYYKYRHTDNSAGTDKYYFAYMTKGNGKICTDSETVEVKEGDVFFIPSGTKYHSYWRGEDELEFISLGFVFFPDFDGNRYPVQAFKGRSEAVGIMKNLASKKELSPASIGEFYTLIALLLPDMKCVTNNRKNALVNKAKRLIAERPECSVGDVAKACAVSVSALYAAFSSHSDKSINDFRKETVLKRARELLVSTDLSIEEIARRLNFSSGAYFRKCFKEYFQRSPREIRRMGGI